MRTLIFLLAGFQIAAFIYLALQGGAEVEGSGLVTLGGVILAVFLAPALILAINRKALGIALVLASVPLVLAALGVGGT